MTAELRDCQKPWATGDVGGVGDGVTRREQGDDEDNDGEEDVEGGRAGVHDDDGVGDDEVVDEQGDDGETITMMCRRRMCWI